MADKLGLDNQERDLKLGTSFDSSSQVAFHSFRYDFKPASVDTTKMSEMEIGDNNSVMVTVPHVQGTSQTVYKGNKRPVQKECVLIIDHATGEITLEKLSSTIQLKKTRTEGTSKVAHMAARPLTPSDQVKKDVKKEKSDKKKPHKHKTSPPSKPEPVHASIQPPRDPQPQQPPPVAAVSPVGTMSDSSSDEGVLSTDSDDEPPKSSQSTPQNSTQQRNMYATSLLNEDLRLSESSSDSD